VVVLWLLLPLALVAALLLLVGRHERLRRRLGQLEQRVQALELEDAATLVIEPPSPPRPPNQLLN